MNKTTSCLRCGAPINPPRSGHYKCEFCGASYFAGGIFSRGVYYIKRVSQTKGFNSSIIIPAGLGSLLLLLLIFFALQYLSLRMILKYGVLHLYWDNQLLISS